MNKQNQLSSLFPLLEEVPEKLRLTSPIHQKQILLNGMLIEWNGPVHTVFSPIYIKNTMEGEESQYLIGSYPLY